MTKTDVLMRVAEDLAAGHTSLATQRLRTLVAAVPNDLELYRRLAGVYRLTGNVAEAGRWGYVTADVTDEELYAFEKAHPSPWLRLRMLRWTADAGEAEGPDARKRLTALVIEAKEVGPPARYRGVRYNGKQSGGNLPGLFVTTVLVLFTVLGSIGLLRIVSWILMF